MTPRAFTWLKRQKVETRANFSVEPVEVFDLLNQVDDFDIPSYEQLKSKWRNLLFYGDNKDMLIFLLDRGFGGKVDLIYIDPPFGSGVNYARRIKIKNSGSKNHPSETINLRQTTYSDVWTLEGYLQFMYERLVLLKELLSQTGSIYVHLDWRMASYVRVLMDEIFGEENFLSEIIWYRYNKIPDRTKKLFFKMHDTILLYAKEKGKHYFAPVLAPMGKRVRRRKLKKIDGKIATVGEYTEYEKELLLTKSVIDYIPDINIGNFPERLGFETQKPQQLIELFMQASSRQGDLVLDCFMGSGTTAAVAQNLNRRWIGCDASKIAIHLTSTRVQKIIKKQLEENPPEVKQNTNGYHLPFIVYQINPPKDDVFSSISKNPEGDSPEVDVKIKREGNKALIEIIGFTPSKIEEKLTNTLDLQDFDFRGLIDYVAIDNDYNGKVFHIVYFDAPEGNTPIKGKYEVNLSKRKTNVAVKIVDLFGREVVITKEI